jgi:N-acetylglucosaminyldiphosphoundecaprenol N-acetyl-beta-D-mannosaminyltransferase
MKNKVISIGISEGDLSQVVEDILQKAFVRQSSYACLANAHMTIEAHQDSYFSKVVNEADWVTADGWPIAKFIQMLYGIKQERIAGMDLLPLLIKEAEERDLSILFFGGNEKMLSATQDYINQQYPGIKRHLYYSPPFKNNFDAESDDIIELINADWKPHLIFVVLGCPKQERWMHGVKGKVNACMIGVGGALPVLIGLQKRAPRWMQRLGLEWFFRWLQEPRRLFRRYLMTNSLFIMLAIKEWMRFRLRSRKQS